MPRGAAGIERAAQRRSRRPCDALTDISARPVGKAAANPIKTRCRLGGPPRRRALGRDRAGGGIGFD